MSLEGEVNRFYRGLRRRINRGKPLDSYPFLSGDSYFFSCQYYFESGLLHRVPAKLGRVQKESSLFVRIGELVRFVSYLNDTAEEKFSDITLVLHNGDDNIPENLLKFLATRFRRIYAVNLLQESQSFSPIPIGLENRNLFTNGVPIDFEKSLASNRKNPQDRTTLVLQAFSVHTNREERENCITVASQLGSKRLQHATPFEYRRALSESKFVLSPAGNGYDCHRTWEAMYLGAIPILRRVHWPFINRNLPVLLVDEWENLLELDLSTISVPQNPTWSEDFWNSFYND
ncbi:hypothetical protein MCETOYE15_00046 [Candidatus Nanopelagicaceae bacterium]